MAVVQAFFGSFAAWAILNLIGFVSKPWDIYQWLFSFVVSAVVLQIIDCIKS